MLRSAERGLRQRRQASPGLVRRQLADPPYVSLVVAERGLEEGLHEPGHLVERVEPTADGDHVGVVVLAGEPGGLVRPYERAADALDLVGRHLLAVARAADD